MIEVRLFAYVPDVSRSRQRRKQVPYSEGLTVRDLLEMEGIAGEDLAIMVNGASSSADALLNDGDSVFFLPAIAGGGGAYAGSPMNPPEPPVGDSMRSCIWAERAQCCSATAWPCVPITPEAVEKGGGGSHILPKT